MGVLCSKCLNFRPATINEDSATGNAENNGKLPEPKPQETDPRLPLNARQKFQISKSWKGIERALTPTAVSMFVKLFENNKELLTLFQKFQYLKSKDDQRNSQDLADHASNVMSTIHNAICSLDTYDGFVAQLRLVGAFHHNIAEFKPEYFWEIEQPFLDAVKETLDDRYTENMEVIYKITIKLILENLVEGYHEGSRMLEEGKKLPTRNEVLANISD